MEQKTPPHAGSWQDLGWLRGLDIVYAVRIKIADWIMKEYCGDCKISQAWKAVEFE